MALVAGGSHLVRSPVDFDAKGGMMIAYNAQKVDLPRNVPLAGDSIAKTTRC